MSAARERTEYVACSVCGESRADYLFFRAGVRFVRCVSCALVYVSPVGMAGPGYFDMAETGRWVTPEDQRLALGDLAGMLQRAAQDFTRRRGSAPRHTLLLGRYLSQLADLPELSALNLQIAPIDGAAFARLSERADIAAFAALIRPETDLVVLNELLEACSDPGKALGQVAARLAPGAELLVVYADAESLPARLLRRHWPPFFDLKRAFFTLTHLTRLAARHDLALVHQQAMPVRRTPRYVLERLASRAPGAGRWLRHVPKLPRLSLLTGLRSASFERRAPASARAPEKLSIILPAYEEVATVGRVIEALLEKPLRLDRELIIVESNSRDGTRELVERYRALPGVTLILQAEPRGKGHAVRAGLPAASGSIVLIQDADLEYDIDDYDALLEPILQGRANFVLGSRTLGADDWKVRKFASGALSGLLLNVAQVGFARTFNLLYQQRTTDVNTMFKVFRRSCLDGVTLESDGFELDIELVCKLVLAGHAPLEVPVNYAARDFEQGKKIRFWRDALPSYAAFFKFRLGR